MSPRLLRLIYAFEFLIALVAIFTVWSEVGGQAALDLMYWAWKLGFSVSLALSFVLYTAAIVSEDSLWTMRSARWLTLMIVIFLGMGAVTWYYGMEAATGDSDETGTISKLSPLGALSDCPATHCGMARQGCRSCLLLLTTHRFAAGIAACRFS
jgi:hypothetical protein